MTLETWWLYLGAIVLIACTPGPNVLYVTTRSIQYGLRASAAGMAGCLLALVLMLVGSVAGLSALLITLPAAFDVLQISRRGLSDLARHPDVARRRMNRRTWLLPCPRPPSAATFRGGFLVGISNPKLLIFAAAFFPQFITPTAPWAAAVRPAGRDIRRRRAHLLRGLCAERTAAGRASWCAACGGGA